MAKKLKISVSQTQTIREAFDDFLLQKKALGLADKTIETYSHHFGIISKYLDSSAPIAGLFKRPLDEMIERMRSAGMKDTSINSYTRTLKSFLSWCNREGLTQANINGALQYGQLLLNCKKYFRLLHAAFTALHA